MSVYKLPPCCLAPGCAKRLMIKTVNLALGRGGRWRGPGKRCPGSFLPLRVPPSLRAPADHDSHLSPYSHLSFDFSSIRLTPSRAEVKASGARSSLPQGTAPPRTPAGEGSLPLAFTQALAFLLFFVKIEGRLQMPCLAMASRTNSNHIGIQEIIILAWLRF